jgi:hypothetical protein
LQTAATEAAQEVIAACAAIEADHQTPLADRLGIEPWKIDVLIAALGSIAINGLACGLMIFGAHGRRVPTVMPEVITPVPAPVPVRSRLKLVASHQPAVSIFEFAPLPWSG